MCSAIADYARISDFSETSVCTRLLTLYSSSSISALRLHTRLYVYIYGIHGECVCSGITIILVFNRRTDAGADKSRFQSETARGGSMTRGCVYYICINRPSIIPDYLTSPRGT